MRLLYDINKNAGVLAPNSKYRSRVTQFANQEFKPVKMIKTEITGEDFNFKEKPNKNR